ncbi:alpha/beta hydrolase [Paenalcaligenes niemegkensis]|uniref:alpha/beta fold hydrolase n=1 Tax=Paenalcaligenes niemegkensis TaxID=2895469 RepID=UPI001EE7D387|nr:alpha/beta hydrolase [Paenalcaligenes niemegkensis]MCQ9617545.1 alpha/beta hydrolase [Paenalcaligenes niemegkensis]
MLAQKTTEFEGIPLAYWEGGSGSPLLLLHGSGPGASTQGNWRLILEPLSQHFHVIAVDLIGFGLSGRKPAPPYFDFELWVRQAAHMLEFFQAPQIDVLGHSLSGAIALKLASVDTRIRKVVTTGTMGTAMEQNPALDIVWTFPETTDDLVTAGHTLVYDDALIDDAYIEGRKKVLYDGAYKTYFSSMFQGDKQQYVRASTLSDEDLAALSHEILLIHGRDDKPIPASTSSELAEKLENADLVILSKCNHSVALEHPKKLIGLMKAFLQ